MEIINMPIAEYLKTCKTVAFQRGFLWIMVLLARERDAMCSYNELKCYWDSFDDLTGDKILFIMSIANRREESYMFYPAHETEEWVRIYNPHLMIMNREVPTISRWAFPSDKKIQEYKKIAIESNTHYISELCHQFNISEKDVPSIVLFCTEPFKENKPVVIPIKSDDLYASIKNFIIEIEPKLEDFKKYRTEINKLELDLQKLKSSIQQNLISSPERRYLKAKTELLHVIKTGSIDVNIQLLQKAIEEKDISACKRFPQPIRGYLNQMIDLQKNYKEIEGQIAKKWSYEQQLYARQKELEKTKAENCDMLKKVRDDLDYAIMEYAIKKHTEDSYERSVKGENRMNNRVPRFKIGITFSGRYRDQYVEPFCSELLNLGYNRDDIFYDEWHKPIINGVHGDSKLREIYFKCCDCVVVLLSPDYSERNWTGNIEWQAVRELINTGNGDKICLLRVGSVDIGSIDGLYSNQAITTDIDEMDAHAIANFIDQRYRYLRRGGNP